MRRRVGRSIAQVNHTLKYKNPTLVLKKKDLSDEAGKYQRKLAILHFLFPVLNLNT